MADDDAPTGGPDQQSQTDDTTQTQTDTPGGQQDARDDTDRQQIADDVRQDAKDQGKTLTQTEVDKIVAERIARERKKFSDYDDLKKAAARLREIEDSQKSELQKKDDELTKAQVELQRYRVAEIRRAAASAAGLDPELSEFITAADEDEALEQAKKLAERLKATKSADLKQGPRTSPPPVRSRDELLRSLAGYGRH